MLACAKSTGVVDKHVLLGWGSRPCLRNFQSCRRRRSLPYLLERGSKPLPDGKTLHFSLDFHACVKHKASVTESSVSIKDRAFSILGERGLPALRPRKALL